MARKAGRYLAGRYGRCFTALGLVLVAGGCAVDKGAVAIDPALMTRNEPGQRVLRLCDQLYEKASYYVAIGMCARAHELNPTATEPLVTLAASAHQVGDYESASLAYRQVLATHPNHAEALYGLGRVHLAQQEYEKAYTVLQSALLAAPEDSRVYNALGVAKDQIGEHAAAQDHYRAGLAFDPQAPALLNNLQLSMSLSPEVAPAPGSDNLAADPRIGETQLSSLAEVPRSSPVAAMTPRPADGAPVPLYPRVAGTSPSKSVRGSQTAALPNYRYDSDADRITAGALREEERHASNSAPVPTAKPMAPKPMTQMAALPQPDRATDAEQRKATGPITSASGRKGYAVQFGAFRSAERAEKGWQEVQQATGVILEHATPVIAEADLGPEKGIFYRVQSQVFARAAAAAALCGEVKAKSLDCLVVRVEDAAVPTNKPVARASVSSDAAPAIVAPPSEPMALPPVAPVYPEEPWIVGAAQSGPGEIQKAMAPVSKASGE
ncbi:MAG: SPOR domain-containing protein [Kiloniellales bacterium]